MHLDGLDLNLLIALDALLSERSVTAAADKVFVSQPAMSGSLSKLRAHLSDSLLERAGREYMLTPLAQDLAPRVRDLLQNIRILLNRRAEFNPETDERFVKIAMTGYCAKVFGVPALHELHRCAPAVRVLIQEVDADVFLRIHSADLDYGITVAQMDFHKRVAEPERIDRMVLFEDGFVLVSDKANARALRNIDLDSFAKMMMVTTRQGSQLLSVVERSLQALPKGPRVALTVPSADLALDALLGTDLITIVPSKALLANSNRNRFVVVQPPVPVPTLQEVLSWHHRIDADSFHAWFRNFLLQFSNTWKNRS